MITWNKERATRVLKITQRGEVVVVVSLCHFVTVVLLVSLCHRLVHSFWLTFSFGVNI